MNAWIIVTKQRQAWHSFTACEVIIVQKWISEYWFLMCYFSVHWKSWGNGLFNFSTILFGLGVKLRTKFEFEFEDQKGCEKWIMPIQEFSPKKILSPQSSCFEYILWGIIFVCCNKNFTKLKITIKFLKSLFA